MNYEVLHEKCRLCDEVSPVTEFRNDGVCPNCGFKTFKSDREVRKEMEESGCHEFMHKQDPIEEFGGWLDEQL